MAAPVSHSSAAAASAAASAAGAAAGNNTFLELLPAVTSPAFLRTGRIILLSTASSRAAAGAAPERPDEMTRQAASQVRDVLHNEFDSGAQGEGMEVLQQFTAAELQEASENYRLRAFFSGDKAAIQAAHVLHDQFKWLQEQRVADAQGNLVAALRADGILRHFKLRFTYREAMASLVVHREVAPETIAQVLEEEMAHTKSALIVAFGHGDEAVQLHYNWKALLSPYVGRLDGAIFMQCTGKQTIKPKVRKLKLLTLTCRRNVRASHIGTRDALKFFLEIYLSFVTAGWYAPGMLSTLHEYLTYGSWKQSVSTRHESEVVRRWRQRVSDAPTREDKARCYTYRAADSITQPREHADLMIMLMEYANEFTKTYRDSSLREQDIQDLARLEWSEPRHLA